MARVLGRVRLSRSTDESTSVSRQRQHVEDWARLHGHDVIGWAIDDGVSGSVSPFDAPALGPWLTPERAHEYDIVAAYRLDRMARRTIPLNRLFGWCLDNGKALVSTSEAIDLSTPVGRLIANVIAFVAEGELDAIRERAADSQKELRVLGRYHGGPVPYGYTAVKADTGYGLDINPDQAAVVESIVDRVIGGESIRSVARQLNEDGVKPPKGDSWNAASLAQVLRSRALLGQKTHNGAVVTGTDGIPVQRAEGLITETRFKELQHAIDTARKGPAGSKGGPPALLLDIAYCGGCGSKMYVNRRTNSVLYRCSGKTHRDNGCKELSAPADRVEPKAVEFIRTEIGDQPVTERVFVPAEGPGDELERVDDLISLVRREKDLGLYDGDDAGYLARLTSLSERKRRIQETPSKPARYERVATGGTWSDRIDNATSDQDVRDVLVMAGLRMDVTNRGFAVHFTTNIDREAVPGPLPQDDSDHLRKQQWKSAQEVPEFREYLERIGEFEDLRRWAETLDAVSVSADTGAVGVHSESKGNAL